VIVHPEPPKPEALQPDIPLHGITLSAMLEFLIENLGSE